MSGKQNPQSTPKSTPKSKPKSKTQSEIDDYLTGFTEQERIVMDIAVQHLETSFDITKSIGFIEWKQSKSKSKSISK